MKKKAVINRINVHKYCLLENKDKILSNIKNVIYDYWHIVSINENLRNVFDKRSFIAYRRNTNFHRRIGGNRILKKLNVKTPNNENNQETAHHASQD